jgi:hypothetical protein
MQYSRGLLTLFGVIALATGSFYLATRALRTQPPKEATPTETSSYSSGEMTLNKAKIEGLSDGKKVWEIDAPTVTVTKQQNRTRFFGNVKAQLFTDNAPRAHLTTKEATYEKYSRKFSAPGSVSVHLFPRPSVLPSDPLPVTEAMDITTSNLTWDVTQKLLQCPQQTHIKLAQGEATFQNVQIHLETHSAKGENFRGRYRVIKQRKP